MGKKNTETAANGDKERGCICVCVCAWLNVPDHVHSMRKESKNDRESKHDRKQRKLTLYTVSVI